MIIIVVIFTGSIRHIIKIYDNEKDCINREW